MKAILLIRSLANPHGVERTITDKANYLVQQGHSVLLVTYEQGSHPFVFPLDSSVEHRDLDCRYFTLYRYSFLKRQLEALKMRRRFKDRLRELIADFQPQVLITTTYSTDFMSETMAASVGVPVIVESHSAFSYDQHGTSIFHKLWLHRFLQSLKKSTLVVALTQGDAGFWRHYVSTVKVVPNPLPCFPEQADDSHRQANRILSVGRLYAPKRFDRLIEAFSLIADRYPEWFLDIYGDGEDRELLTAQIARLGLSERVHLKAVTNDIFSEYKKSQFLVVSSDFEGFSLVLIEAMACGLPSVSTACPYGPPEIVDDGVTGLLADLSPDDLATKMEWMMTHDAERQKMGRQAREASAKYRKETVMRAWEAAYLSVLS